MTLTTPSNIPFHIVNTYDFGSEIRHTYYYEVSSNLFKCPGISCLCCEFHHSDKPCTTLMLEFITPTLRSTYPEVLL